MDADTITVYDSNARAYADDWAAQPEPSDLYEALRSLFHITGPTADIGCGAGRDTAWLMANSYGPTGFDASAGLLDEARRRHPDIRFVRSALPELPDVPRKYYRNVLCETVLMHLDPDAIRHAVRCIKDILTDDGVLCLSWRVNSGETPRDAAGRLYASFDPSIILEELQPMRIVSDQQIRSASSGKIVRRVMAARGPR